MTQSDHSDPAPTVISTQRPGWRLKLPSTPVELDPARALDYRHPRERLAFVVSLVIVAAILTGGIWTRDWHVLSGVLIVWLAMVVIALQAATKYRLQGAEVTATQFPEIHSALEDMRARLSAPPIEAFVIRNPAAQVDSYGIRAPYVIVFHSALLDSLDADQLRFVIGQQLGRIMLGHTRTMAFLGGQEKQLPALFAQLTWLRDLFFAWYHRISYISADRVGVVACGSVDVATQTIGKLAVGNNQIREVAPEDVVEQVHRVSSGLSAVQAGILWFTSSEPAGLLRISAIISWAGLPESLRTDQQRDSVITA